MALCQHHQGKCKVPWFSSVEWKTVFENVYSKDEYDKQVAIENLQVWKARQPLLPAGVEGTLTILEALMLNTDHLSDYQVRLSQSASLMRFLNICVTRDARQGTFFHMAKKANIPVWIIGLRHEVAHSQTLPSSSILQKALDFSLCWLFEQYWSPMSQSIQDFVIDSTEPNFKEEIEPLVSLYSYLVVSRHPEWDVQQIEDADVKNMLLEELPQLHCDKKGKLNVVDVLSPLWNLIESKCLWSNTEKRSRILAELLIENGVFLGTLEDCEPLFTEVDAIPFDFISLWEDTLARMHQRGFLEALIVKLVDLCNSDDENGKSKLRAALWLAELGKALKRNDAEVIAGEVLNLSSEIVPECFSNEDKFKAMFLYKLNDYTGYYLPLLLDFSWAVKTKKDTVIELIDKYTKPSEEFIPISEEEIKMVDNLLQNSREKEKETAPAQPGNSKVNFNGKFWKRTDIDFSDCPIGRLPWQTTKVNPVL